MSNINPASQKNDLAAFIRGLYENWSNDRKSLELKWQRNLDAFKSVSSGKFWKKEEGEGWRSDIFVPLTKMKIITAYSIIIDMLLQGGRLPFNLKPAPWDNIVMDELPEDQKEMIEAEIQDAADRIHQQMSDCDADRQLMKVVLSAAIYGEAYAKRFVHSVERRGYREVNLAPAGLMDPTGQYRRFERTVEEFDSPAWEYKTIWNIFRDLETDDLQACQGVIERDLKSAYELRQKIGLPFFLDENIEEALSEADKSGDSTHSAQETASLPPGLRDIQHRHRNIETLEFWGRVPRNIVELFEAELAGEDTSGVTVSAVDPDQSGDEVEIHAVIAGENNVIRFSRVDSGDRPYYRPVWEETLDHAYGTGVADNLEDIQLVLNGMVRAFEDNKKLSANAMAGVKKSFLPDWKGDFVPGKTIDIAEECDDVRKAIQQIVIQDVGDSLLGGIGLFERYGDEASQLPKILQGAVHDKQKSDTATEMNMLQANAGKYIGGVLKNFDEMLIEPIVDDFHDYNMENPDTTTGQGNFVAEALGFSSFNDKIVRVNNLMKFITLVLSSEQLMSDVKFRQLSEEIAKALDLDPEQIMKSMEEKTADTAAAQQHQQALQVLEIDKIRAEIGKMNAEIDEIYAEIKIKQFEAVNEQENKEKELENQEKQNEEQDKQKQGAGNEKKSGDSKNNPKKPSEKKKDAPGNKNSKLPVSKKSKQNETRTAR